MAWQIEFDPDALKELKKLDKPIQARLVAFLRDRLSPMDDPRSIGEALWLGEVRLGDDDGCGGGCTGRARRG